MWSRDQIEKVRSALDIIQVIREYVPSLSTSGRTVKGLCPFHNEKTASFHVNAEKGLFKCFGCGEAGDVIGFVSKMESVGFPETVERLAQRAGIPLQSEKGPKLQEAESFRSQLFRVLEAAQKFYEERLWADSQGQVAREFVEFRQVTEETARLFHLGWAPDRGGSAFEALIKKGFSIDVCQQAGLVARSSSGKYYDPLFGRLIFPIFDSFGHVVGFGGRVIPKTSKKILGVESQGTMDDGPKYLNSPETPVFSKGRLLYGLNQAKESILSQKKVVVLEGYMDVIGVHQAGFKSSVATLGTAFTKDHSRLIKRYCDEVISFFDADEAGRRAALRGLDPLLGEDLYPRVVQNPGTDDPDEFINKNGLDAFKKLVEAAPDFVEYLLGQNPDPGKMPLKDKVQTAQQILKWVALSPNEILKAEWKKKVALHFGFEVQSLERELKKSGGVLTSRPEKVLERRNRVFIPSAEEEIIQLLIQDPKMSDQHVITEEDFSEENPRRVFRSIKLQMGEWGKISVPSLCEEFSQEDQAWLMNLALEEKQFEDPWDRLNQLVHAVRFNRDKKRLTQLSQIMARGEASRELLEEYRELLRRVKGSERIPVS